MTTTDKTAWQEKLTPQQFDICWNKATEPRFSGDYLSCQKDGIYRCVCCGNPLFNSSTKYNSGSGWPSFWQLYQAESVREITDTRHGMVRIEVVCKDCGAHLGHLFQDGPKPTGLRYCINSAALVLQEKIE